MTALQWQQTPSDAPRLPGTSALDEFDTVLIIRHHYNTLHNVVNQISYFWLFEGVIY